MKEFQIEYKLHGNLTLESDSYEAAAHIFDKLPVGELIKHIGKEPIIVGYCMKERP